MTLCGGYCSSPPHSGCFGSTGINFLSQNPHFLRYTSRIGNTDSEIIRSIVQDDKEDWAEESKIMGLIYERAQLTIAAATAANSSEGCFVWEKNPTVLIPFSSNTSAKPCTALISAGCDEMNHNQSTLGKRAWVLQEWRISRRVVSFGAEGASWRCKEAEWDAWDGEVPEFVNLRRSSWSWILEDFAYRELTFKTDRLAALDGLANAMKKVRKDQYRYGVWSNNLPEQLMWTQYVITPESEDLCELPSWSWASRGGKKHFWQTSHTVKFSRELYCKRIEVVENTLQIRGSLKPCLVTHNTGNRNVEESIFWTLPGEYFIRNRKIHCILDTSNDNFVVGIAALDCRTKRKLHCLFLMVAPHRKFCWKSSYPPWLNFEDVSPS